MAQPIALVRDSYPKSPAFDTAVARALLLRVSTGDVGETFRLHLPARSVAFGKQDTIAAGYDAAVAAARNAGFEAVERLAGGRAAVFHEGTLAFSWTVPADDPVSGIHERFRRMAALLQHAFARLGVMSHVGELPGEYCPGEYSISAGGRKVMGVGQRLARNAAHVGGVIVVSDGSLVRSVLVPVYRALGLEWKPETAGSLQDVAPATTLAVVADAVVGVLGESNEMYPTVLDEATLDLAADLSDQHRSPASGS